MDKEEVLKEIRQKLEMSDRAKWAGLSTEMRKAVVQKYYDLRSIQTLGIQKVLEDNVAVRRTLATLLLGIIFGVLGSLLSMMMWKYLERHLYPALSQHASEVYIDMGFLLIVGLALWGIFRAFNQMLAEHLAEEDVLGHLIVMAEADQVATQATSGAGK